MKSKKILYIVLMMAICFSTMDINVYAATAAECTAQAEAASAKVSSVEEVISNILSNVTSSSTATTLAATTKTATLASTTASYTQAELRLMSAIIYCEAGGESYAGKVAVGIVVMNRKSSSKFPNTVRGVIYQKSQFQPTRNGSMTRALKQYDAGKFTSASEKACIKAAKAVLTGQKSVTYKSKTINLKGYYYFSRVLSGWRVKIGNHKFK